jgi:multicomponent Na+:H+ antiporter subunit E
MAHSFSLLIALFILWLLWSGYFSGLMLAFGAFSCILVVIVCRRMHIADREGQPFHLTLKIFLYLLWLIKEIVKANLNVAFRILSPTMPIDPVVVRFKPSQKTDLGRVILANSITLTPGTITVLAEGEEITVHAIDRRMMTVEENEMDRRVSRMEKRS